MVWRCEKCGRPIPKYNGTAPRMCNGKDGCKNKKLPRCTYCRNLYEESYLKGKGAICPSSQAPGGRHDFGEVE